MADVPGGFMAVSLKLTHSKVQRPCFVTWGAVTPFTGISTDAANSLMQIIKDPLDNLFDSEAKIGPVTLRGGPQATPIVAENEPDRDFNGTFTMASLTPNVALLVRKTTAVGGRRNRGRFYWPFMLGSGMVDQAGFMEAGILPALQAGFTQVRNDLNEAGQPIVILHSEGGTTIPEPTPVLGLEVENLVATQRRRLGR